MEFDHGLMEEGAPKRRSIWSAVFRLVILLTFGVAFLFLVMGIGIVLNPSWGSSLSQVISPYFFILLAAFVLPVNVPIVSVFVVMFALYLIFFSAMVYAEKKTYDREMLDTPIGYFIGISTAVLLVITIITYIEEISGTPIGGSGIDQQLHDNPLLGYLGLIYAPFVEELGFRIIPLGLYSVLLVWLSTSAMRMRGEGQSWTLRTALAAFILPGHVRRKYNVPLRRGDWILIVITSVIFGYAHIYFGAWDWGKFIPVFITGLALAVGFLKFGAYVDIPLHWFFNGFLTLYYLNASLFIVSNLLVLWLLFVGVASTVAVVVYARNHLRFLRPVS